MAAPGAAAPAAPTAQASAADAAPAAPAKSARERILETASDLFYREGIRAVGIDTIIAKSGVAKMSLYRHFASKDELVVAFLEWRDQLYWHWWDGVVAAHPDRPRAQIEALFAGHRRPHPPSRAYRGCAFLNTSTEFPAASDGQRHPAHAVSLMHKEKVRTPASARSPASSAPPIPGCLPTSFCCCSTASSQPQPLLGCRLAKTALDTTLAIVIDAQLQRVALIPHGG